MSVSSISLSLVALKPTPPNTTLIDLISVSVVFEISASKATPEAIKLKNPDTDSQLGIRTATITYINITGNESVSATVSLKEAQRFAND
jgi:hypothetical protein